MATLREVRGRINGVKKTQKITRAMKMVAAAKLRRAQTALISARPYATTMHSLLSHLASITGPEADPLFVARPVDRVTLVVITADRGLCGAFNSNVIKAAQARIRTEYASFAERNKLRLVCVGRKGNDFFRKQSIPVEQAFPGVFQRLEFPTARSIVALLLGMYQRGETDLVEVIYNEFKNVAKQQIVVEQFLPIRPDIASGGETRHPTEYIYEPAGPAILRSLLPRYLDFHLWRALLETNAAQEGARMTAMDNATENADEMIGTLQLQYNKARQASITKELLEIVGGAEALGQG